MRPGPGLVVMALAFISGARRGSTSTSSKSSSSTTISSNPSQSPFFTSRESEHEPPKPSILFPAYLGGGGVVTSEDTTIFSSIPQQKIDARNERVNYYNYIYNTYSYLPPFIPPRQKITQEDQHLRLETLSGLKSSSRATRQTRIIRSLNSNVRNQNEVRDGEPENVEISIDENFSKPGNAFRSVIGSGYETKHRPIIVEHRTGKGSLSADNGVSGDSVGLPVQFPSNSGDTSKSFDDDDILALVSEDDLLSEESFDRLTKLSDDKVGYVIVDDYDVSSEDYTNSVSESSIANVNENDLQQKTRDENYTLNKESSASENGSGENENFQNEQEPLNNKSKANVERKIKKSIKSNLSENKHTSAEKVDDNSYVAAFSENGLSHTISSVNSDSQIRNTKWSIFESESPLTRLNPWISACDLAQPGTAPDLQGQCSAGALPVAWVDEGPGPPSCPISCEKLKTTIVKNFNTKTNNNNSMLNKNNDINFKKSTNNDYDTENMSKVRRDLSQWAESNSNNISEKKQETSLSDTQLRDNSIDFIAKAAPVFTVQAPHTANSAIAHALTTANRQKHPAYNIVKMKANQAEVSGSYEYSDFMNFGSKYESNAGRFYNNKQKQQYNGYREQAEPTHHQKQHKEQQCLDYLGDTEETSPAHLCTFKSASELATKLRSLRLRHCCERNVFSALHTVALNATLSGGVECVRILMDVMDLDLLATRITCELAEILFRFDCRQVYSLIHQCDDCKEAYRRWVCSTLVPYFAEESDIFVSRGSKYSNNNNRSSSKFATASSKTNTNDNNGAIVDISNKSNTFAVNDVADPVEKEVQRSKRQFNRNITSSNSLPLESHASNKNSKLETIQQSKRTIVEKCKQRERQEWREGQRKHQKQSNIFISTAINADPCTEDPVISKIIKRSKRSVQFRKRKRIRPCLSVCQTVEQKCPYLLPADRAPALPTQYAGEPTFLCLDQSIPETGEQLRKSSYGPTGCCYGYCDDISDGICAYCSEFLESAVDENIDDRNLTRRLHNITLIATSQYRLDTRLEESLRNDSKNKLAASISIALSNSSATTIASQIDRLTYYALYDGIYYYDENMDDMPTGALSDDCPPVPSVTSRCSIPYYASSAVAVRTKQSTMANNVSGHHILLLLSALLCLLTSQTAAMQLKYQVHPNRKQFRKYLQQFTKPTGNGSGTEPCVRHNEEYTVAYAANTSMHLMFYSRPYLQKSEKLEDTKQGFRKSKAISFSLKDPSMLNIFHKSTIGTYFNKGIYNSKSSQHCVQKCDRRVPFCMEKNFVRSRSRNRSDTKNKSRESKRKWKRNQNRNGDRDRDRKLPVSTYEMTEKYRWEKTKTVQQMCSALKRSKEKINSTEYNDSVKNKYVQLNIGNNNKITFRLNSKLYFNSNTKIYRRKKISTFRNFNIATITDYNKHHIKRIIQTTTSSEHTNNICYNCSYNNIVIGSIQFSNMEKKFQFIYYYNFNINDWWRRWWCIWDSTGISQRVPSVIL